ncbi:MAG: HD domain-containing phosphohydrolase [Solirubrobacterales bacterium]
MMLADLLDLEADQRRVLASAARQLDGGKPTLQRVNDFQPVMQAVLYARERWDGEEGGFPGVLSGEQIPIESRVLAVAHEWSSLTAQGTRELEPEVALAELRSRAGADFDPHVVAAAAQAVEQGLVPVDPSKPIRLRPEPALRTS